MQDTQIGNETRGSEPPVAINLGIDFGTSFTKVCFRDVGTEETEVVTFGGVSTEEAMLPSIVNIEIDGKLSPGAEPGRDGTTQLRYLKMGLADTVMPIQPPTWRGVDLNRMVVIKALSSWYLATVVSAAQTWIQENRGERLRGRTVQWSANVGVPVEYYDSPAIDTFREVLSTGWSWVMANDIPSDFETALVRYEEEAEVIRDQITDCHALPEIAAAVQSFIVSREAQPGIYVYFDIGGGTVDGVAFDYLNVQGERRVNFYSGKVEALGISAIASRVVREDAEAVEASLIFNDVTYELEKTIEPLRLDVQKLVANVIITAKKKDVRDWQRDAFQDRSQLTRRLARMDPSDMIPLHIFLGGAGAGSEWYQDTILSTHEDFKHLNAGIPPYELMEVPRPGDLNMNGLQGDGFRRLAIAYGLSVPFGEGPDTGLPSEFAPAKRPKARQPLGVVDYGDSKDVYD